jgi:hypothetical protein
VGRGVGLGWESFPWIPSLSPQQEFLDARQEVIEKSGVYPAFCTTGIPIESQQMRNSLEQSQIALKIAVSGIT